MSELRTPAVIVNFKAYSEVEGPGAMSLAQVCQDISDETGASIAICPPVVELSAIAAGVTIPVLSQHIDAKGPGAATGYVTAEMVKAAGAAGSLLNHSEHRMVLSDLAMGVDACRRLGLTSVVCTDTSTTSAAAASLGPEFIAVEPPELIGGDISVTDARPEVVEDAVKAVRRVDDGIKVLCGAGVKSGKDVQKAVKLGASGVLLASGVVRSKDVRATLADLVHLL